MDNHIFWFCNYNQYSSFYRISNNLIPLLDYKIHTILETTKNQKIINDYQIFYKYINYLDNIKLSDKYINYDNYRLINKNESDFMCKTKYIFLQSLYYCKHNSINKMIILTGIQEALYYNQIINEIKKSKDNLIDKLKFIYYIPFDYISYEISNLEKNGLVLTTFPYIGISSIYHSIDKCFKYLDISRNYLINIVNRKFNLNLKGNEIIILNANTNTDRKRIQLTVDSFNKLVNVSKLDNLILWLHSSDYDNINNIPTNCIKSKNLESRDLNYIYNICQIGLQTSNGEGWSLTNCEHSICGGIQVVPNFLATGYHFNYGRGILIKTYLEFVNGNIYNKLYIDDIVISLLKAIFNINKSNIYTSKCIDYFKNYKWELEACKFNNILNIIS